MNTKAKEYGTKRETFSVKCASEYVAGITSRSDAFARAQLLANKHGVEAAVSTFVNGISMRSAMYVEPSVKGGHPCTCSNPNCTDGTKCK